MTGAPVTESPSDRLPLDLRSDTITQAIERCVLCNNRVLVHEGVATTVYGKVDVRGRRSITRVVFCLDGTRCEEVIAERLATERAKKKSMRKDQAR